jgi:HD-GYP domain-containing protein (c-di-GMP phosphodiesterase class II)
MRELLPAGSLISADTLEELITSNRAAPLQSLPLLQHASVKADLLCFMHKPPYGAIFPDPDRNVSLLNLMEEVRLVPPLLRSLDYFKAHDPYTYRHILMVFALSALLSQLLGASHQNLVSEVMAGPTHDFGKICVPLHILKKSAPLTQSERRNLEHHAAAGFVLLAYYHKNSKDFAALVARDHHERRDGSGYPRGIPLEDRLVEIVAASDVYDALLSPRPYRLTSYDNRTALEELTRMAEGKALSWEVVRALVAFNRTSKPHYSDCIVSTEKRGKPPDDNRYGVIVPENDHSPEGKEGEKREK